jgi:DNA polymerase I-like protein with 3'-5' exonuclease and polymerase domains
VAEDPVLNMVGEARKLNRHKEIYLDKLFFKFSHNGRIHPIYNQAKMDEGGTITGRFTCKQPNLQQIPSRELKYAEIIRSLVIPEEGEQLGKYDYSQQEPRLLVHFSDLLKLEGASKVRQKYLDNPESDYYMLVAAEAHLKRKPAKDLTLGICYGEGIYKIAQDLGVEVEEAKQISEVFNTANPYILELSRIVQKKVKERGYVKTLSGRRRHFTLWEPAFMRNQRPQPVRHEAAKAAWPMATLQRAYTYKGLNALIQGSAADMTKYAMLKIWEEERKFPLLQVHDELVYSVDTVKRAERFKKHMETAVKLQVPLIAELKLGKHWS